MIVQGPLTIVQPIGYGASSCGYCSPKGQRSRQQGSKSYGAVTHRLAVQDYQDMIDRGWRRSGTYCYKPDMARTCCPHFTIRLDAASFKASKSQRQLLNRFHSFIVEGNKTGAPGFGPASEKAGPTAAAAAAAATHPSQTRSSKGKGRQNQAFDLLQVVQACETSAAHRFESSLEPADFTEEKFELFKRYQMEIHGDTEAKVSKSGFNRFLCDSPLEAGSSDLGSFHHMYRIDGQLVAVGVLDILPHAVSSVYLTWDPAWSGLALGKVSAMKEIALTLELHAKGVLSAPWYYMGFYIHSCPKMVYKAQYHPSFLLEPETNRFVPYETCKPLLEENEHRTTFNITQQGVASHQSTSNGITETNRARTPVSTNTQPSDEWEDEDGLSDSDVEDDEQAFPDPFPGALQSGDLSRDLLINLKVLEGRTVRSFLMSRAADNPSSRKEVIECAGALGEVVSSRAIFYTF